jgi:hypothetical protein
VLAVFGLLVASRCSGPAASTSTAAPTTLPAATTVPGSMADPLTAPVRARAAMSAPLAGGPAAPVPTVTAPGATFRTPAQVAGLPVAEVGGWRLVARSADDRYLLVGITFGGCERLVALEVTPAATAVTITPRMRTAGPGAVCPAFIAVSRYIVDIGGPLGSRPLLHPPPG